MQRPSVLAFRSRSAWLWVDHDHFGRGCFVEGEGVGRKRTFFVPSAPGAPRGHDLSSIHHDIPQKFVMDDDTGKRTLSSRVRYSFSGR